MNTNLAGGPMDAVLQHLRHVVARPDANGRLDRQLLEQFLAKHDETAFAALVRRHGPMVLGICRRVLRNEHDAEDAFQATFLILAHKTGSIRKQTSPGSWLHGVALRLAVRTKTNAAHRRLRERRRTEMNQANPMADVTWQELRTQLDEELQQLPEQFRAALVLCYLQGKTQDEAAHQLGWSKATLRRRLGQGRELLRVRLVRRGLALSAALFTSLLADSAAQASVPARLVGATARAASGVAAGKGISGLVSAQAAALVEGGLQALAATRVKVATAVVLALVLLAGAGLAAHQATANKSAARVTAPAPGESLAPTTAPKDETAKGFPVRGRVLDPDGKPVAGAHVCLYADAVSGQAGAHPAFAPIWRTTGTDGRFSLRLVEADLPKMDERGLAYRPMLTAFAPGFEAAWKFFNQIEDPRNIVLKLVKDDVPLDGRVVDLEGRPIPGITVRVVRLLVFRQEDLTAFQEVLRTRKTSHEYNEATLDATAAGLSEPVVSGTDGRIRVRGIGRERCATLRIEGPTIESRFVLAMTRPGSTITVTDTSPFGRSERLFHGAQFEHVAAPTRPVEGTIRDKNTGEPLAGVQVESVIPSTGGPGPYGYIKTTTDKQGRFRIVGLPADGSHEVMAIPAIGQPYLPSQKTTAVNSGVEPVTLDFALKRGIVLRGRVTDRATRRPVHAHVDYFAFLTNPHLREASGLRGSDHCSTTTAADGSFQLVGLPGRGILAARIEGPGADHYLTGVGADRITGADKQGRFETDPYICDGRRFHALTEIDPAPDGRDLLHELVVDPGVSVHGFIVGPDGKPVTGVHVQGTWSYRPFHSDFATDRFTLPAVDPARAQPFFFSLKQRHQGAVVVLRGNKQQPVTVRLQPCAILTGRLLDAEGDPIADKRIWGHIEEGQLDITVGWYGFFQATTDKDGRFRITDLIPGIKLGAVVEKAPTALGGSLFEHLTLRPSETCDLGDLKEQPR
jgi:RNA polymerase sigma factor (sigma-70 family)